MKKCANCGLENDDDEACCSECGKTEFTSADAPAKSETQADPQSSEPPAASGPTQPGYTITPLSEADREKDLVTVVTCRTLMEADFAVSRLNAAGIEAFIPDKSVMAWDGWNFNTFGYVRVQIAPKDYEAARDLLGG